jgi:alpha-glucosidase
MITSREKSGSTNAHRNGRNRSEQDKSSGDRDVHVASLLIHLSKLFILIRVFQSSIPFNHPSKIFQSVIVRDRMTRQTVIFFFLMLSTASAQWKSIGNVDSYNVSGNKVELIAGTSVVRLTLLADDLVRVRASRDGRFAPDLSVAVIDTTWDSPRFAVDTTGGEIILRTSHMTVVIRKTPLRLVFEDSVGTILNEDDPVNGMGWNGDEVRVWKKKPEGENYFGLGEKAGSLNRTGKCFTMWNSDIPGYKADTDPLYQSVPFFYGMKSGSTYGIFFDNTYRSSFDFGKESPDRFSFGAVGGEINYYFFVGPRPDEVLSRFTELVGRMPLPPRWSLGYQQCRWSYYPETRVRNLAATFREKKIPCDVIYLDIDYMEGYRIFTWSKKNFPNPRKMIGDLAKEGFKFVVIVDPGIKVDSAYRAYESGTARNVFLRNPDGHPFIGKVWPGDCAFPDFSNPEARSWWGDLFRTLTDAGVRGFWNDMNEPSVFDGPDKTMPLDVVHYDNGLFTSHAKNHNTYGMLMTQATYEGIRRLRPGERPFVLTRASYAGGQRYAAAWTGDNESRWDNLEMALSMSLGVSISGQPFIGSDIGGFIGNPSGELFARWLELGVFTPLMRGHSVIGSPDKEPWAFGPKYERVNRETIDLRYKFLPYIYTVMDEASRTGLPAMRPLCFAYPNDPSFMQNEDEFMFGDDLLIAPVLWPGDTTRTLLLPNGVWFDYWTDQKYEGGRQVTVTAPINRLPIFVKGGATIPTQPVVQFTDQNPANPLMLTVFPDSSSSSAYYEDDGVTFQYEQGDYLRRAFEQRRSKNQIDFWITKSEGNFQPPERSLVVQLVDVSSEPQRVSISGVVLEKGSWNYDAAKKTLTLTTKDTTEERRIEVRF